MISLLESIVFTTFTIYALLKAIGYGIYEIKNENNRYGGIFIISFSTFSVILVNIAFYML